jgi:TetR/AcrR family transcriptional repressor of lmrAB and yxaGH operons
MPNEESRSRAVQTASDLFRRQGYAATGVAQVIAESGTPKGSFYFNFPGGKEELGAEALRLGGSRLLAGIRALASSIEEPPAFVGALADALAAGLESSEFQLGCPIATVALETSASSEALRAEAEAQFAAWEEAMSVRLGDDAGMVLATLEGALILARTRRSAEPVRAAGRRLATLLA